MGKIAEFLKTIKEEGEAPNAGGSKTKDFIKELINTSWSGSNEEQMKAVELLKGLATSDDPEANDFMKKLDAATSAMADDNDKAESDEGLEEEKDQKIKKLEDEVKKLHKIKQDAYAAYVDAKEKYGSSDMFYQEDPVKYRQLMDAHDKANDAWDKAYFKLKKLKEKK